MPLISIIVEFIVLHHMYYYVYSVMAQFSLYNVHKRPKTPSFNFMCILCICKTPGPQSTGSWVRLWLRPGFGMPVIIHLSCPGDWSA